MVNFILKVSFDNLSGKEDIPFKEHQNGNIANICFNSYKDSSVLLEYSGSDKNLCLKEVNNKKYLAYVSIFDEDRTVLKNKLSRPKPILKARNDSELMLDLYLEFGQDGFNVLSNGFIFILIDYSKEEVLAFRDHIGIRNICYCHDGESIYLSSSFKNIYALEGLDFNLNLQKIKKFLDINDRSIADTFIKEINKVPPAFFLKYSDKDIQTFKYLKYDTTRSLGSAIDQVAGLKDLLRKSILIDRANSHSKIGFTMSGGIDSSTVISFFKEFKDSDHKIFSFSAQYKHLDKRILNLIDESEYQNEINKSTDIYDTSFDGQDESTLSKLDFYLEVVGQPFFFPNLYLPNKAFSLASDKGVYLVMNGNDGDTVISHGYEYFQELFYNLKWIKLFKEIDVTSRLRKQTRRFIFKRIILDSFSLNSFFNSFAKKKHLDVICSSSHSKAIEIQSLLANYFGIEERYPFYNRELIEYCLNVNPDLKNKHGQARYILKEAIKGIVPEKIRKRVTKSNLGHALCLSFVEKDYELIDLQLSKPNSVIKEIIDLENLRSSWENMKEDPRKYATNSLVPSKIFSYVVLNRWLDLLPTKIIKKLEKNT